MSGRVVTDEQPEEGGGRKEGRWLLVVGGVFFFCLLPLRSFRSPKHMVAQSEKEKGSLCFAVSNLGTSSSYICVLFLRWLRREERGVRLFIVYL